MPTASSYVVACSEITGCVWEYSVQEYSDAPSDPFEQAVHRATEMMKEA